MSASSLADWLEKQLTIPSTELDGACYRTDILLVTSSERIAAGFPDTALIWPTPGDLRDQTARRIHRIHSRYGYESGSAFGALFAAHVESAHLCSISYLYSGQNIWYIIQAEHRAALEKQRNREPDARPLTILEGNWRTMSFLLTISTFLLRRTNLAICQVTFNMK